VAATFDTAPFGEASIGVWIKVLGRQTNGVVETGNYVRNAAFKVTGGTLTQVGSTNTIGTDQESVAGWDVTVDASGDNIQVNVTGANGDTVQWLVQAEIQVNDDDLEIGD
jgi:hypothetical protein